MPRILFAAIGLLTTTALSAAAGDKILTVGPSGQYKTIAAAVAAANADTNLANNYIISVAPGTYTNDTAQITRAMTIQAAVPGSAVILDQTAPLPNQKGILLVAAALTVDGLTLQNAAIDNSLGGNGAGIRAQKGKENYTLTVRNTTFIHNQDGILTDGFPLDVVLINNLFMNNGNGYTNSLGHSVYIGADHSLTAIGNEVCGTILGHDLKSRAAVSVIRHNTLYDGAPDPNRSGCDAGSASFALDLPNGGAAVVDGNRIMQGASTQNPIMVAYGEEGLRWPTNSLTFSNNMMDSVLAGAVGVANRSAVPVTGNGNVFAPTITTPVDPESTSRLSGTPPQARSHRKRQP